MTWIWRKNEMPHTEKLLKLAEISPVNNLYKSVALQFAIKCGAIYEYGLLADFD